LLEKNAGRSRWQHARLALGVSLCSIGAFLMFHGSILSERTTGIATLIGIIGIGTIAGVHKKTEEQQSTRG